MQSNHPGPDAKANEPGIPELSSCAKMIFAQNVPALTLCKADGF